MCVSAGEGWGGGTHFPRGLDSLPDAEEADDPHCQETQGQVPLQGPDVLDPGGDAQHVASAGGHERLERDTHASSGPGGLECGSVGVGGEGSGGVCRT